MQSKCSSSNHRVLDSCEFAPERLTVRTRFPCLIWAVVVAGSICSGQSVTKNAERREENGPPSELSDPLSPEEFCLSARMSARFGSTATEISSALKPCNGTTAEKNESLC